MLNNAMEELYNTQQITFTVIERANNTDQSGQKLSMIGDGDHIRVGGCNRWQQKWRLLLLGHNGVNDRSGVAEGLV